MIDPQIADWLVRFAAGAGTLYEWQVNGNGELRAAGDEETLMCPLSAQETLERGMAPLDATYGLGIAAERLHWKASMAWLLMDAADDALCDNEAFHRTLAEIRVHLLRICRVEEPAA